MNFQLQQNFCTAFQWQVTKNGEITHFLHTVDVLHYMVEKEN